MKVNQPDGPNVNADKNQGISKKPEKPFSVDRTSAGPIERNSLTEKAQRAHFPGITAEFSRNDLSNPQKVDTLVRNSVDDLLRTEFPQARFSSVEAREKFVDLVSKDPKYRQMMVGLLHKVLTNRS